MFRRFIIDLKFDAIVSFLYQLIPITDVAINLVYVMAPKLYFG